MGSGDDDEELESGVGHGGGYIAEALRQRKTVAAFRELDIVLEDVSKQEPVADGCGADGCGADGCGVDGCGVDGVDADNAETTVDERTVQEEGHGEMEEPETQ